MRFVIPAAVGLLGIAGAAAAATISNQVSPLVVVAPPKDAPPADTTVLVGADEQAGGSQAVSIWPKGALSVGANGWVTLRCRIDVHGLAETCRSIYESPRDKGFAAAALALRPTLKIPPKQGADGPVEAEMNISIAFRAPDLESNYADVQRAAVEGLEPDSTTANYGHHELNGKNLIIYHNPVVTRAITMMSEPGWVQAPGFDEVAAAYPAKAAGVEGYTVTHCRVEKTGTLKGCAVVRETPINHGFSTAALSLMPRFQASPQALASAPKGAPIEVDVPIRFAPPEEARDRTVRSPVWIAGLDPASAIRDYPAIAGAKPKSPGAVVQCKVGFDGGLTDCQIELTSPDGIDFDEAAVKLASHLKMNLWSAAAGPVQGGVVHLGVRPDLAETQQAQN
jgi:hypothetical protein